VLIRPMYSLMLATLAACGGRSGLSAPASCDSPDCRADGASTSCDPSRPFGDPVPLEGVSSACFASLSPDELTIYHSDGRYGVKVSTRPTRDAPFGAPLPIRALASMTVLGLSVSSDERTLYFAAGEKPCGPVDDCFRLYWTTRAAVTDEFTTPSRAPVVGDLEVREAGMGPRDVFLTADGRSLYFAWNDTDLYTHIWRSHRVAGTWSSPQRVNDLVGTSGGEASPVLSSDNLSIYFVSGGDVAVASRPSMADTFGPRTKVPTLNKHAPHWISRDGCRLYVDDYPPCRFSVATRR